MGHAFKDPQPFANTKTVSVGICEVLPTVDRRYTKFGKAKVRVIGRSDDLDAIERRATEIAAQLDAGTYKGPKTARV